MAVAINRQDLNRLIQEHSPEVRAHIAGKVAEDFNRGFFTDSETKLAVDIFRLLLRDTAMTVRKAVAEQLKHTDHAPHDIIVALANDETEVAVEVLEHSEVLTDDDLVTIVCATREVQKWMAVARRKQLSKVVSTSLVATHHPKVLAELLSNNGAEIEEADMERVLEEFRGEQSILEALVNRAGLSPVFAEKLYSQVADSLKKQLTQKYRLSWKVANKATEVVKESAILKFLAPWMTRGDIEKLVDQMHRNKRLNYSIVVHALCMGEIDFFELSIAKMADIPVDNVRLLLSDPGEKAARALFLAAGFPADFDEAVCTVYRVALKETEDNGMRRPAFFQARMIDRLVAKGYHEGVENMGYFISLMRQQSDGKGTVH